MASQLSPPSRRAGDISRYQPWYPISAEIDQTVKQFITNFYQTPDSEDRNNDWVNFFHDDAVVVIGKQMANGNDGWPALLLCASLLLISVYLLVVV